MSEDRFAEFLRQAAQDYHRPPATPREAMWARIAAARRERQAARRTVVIRPWLRWGVGIAAVLALGIGIGRLSVERTQPPTGSAGRGNLAYQVAATQYLSRTEVLLTGLRAESRTSRGRLDPQFVTSARDLLSTTRLLLDAPAAQRDPQLRGLLEDLELVLAQISQLPAERGQDDLDLINQGLERRSVLTRLRTAIPAGPSPVRTQGVL